MGRKHCRKWRNCSLRAISPFPTVFSKDLNCRLIKTRLVWERVKIQTRYKNGFDLCQPAPATHAVTNRNCAKFDYTLHYTIPTFNDPEKKRRLLKTLSAKEKMLVNGIFSFAHNVFSSSQHKFQFLSQNYFVVCKCFEFELVYCFVVW